MLGSTPGVERVYLPTEDDAASGPIDIVGGLPTGDTVHTRAYVRQVYTITVIIMYWTSSSVNVLQFLLYRLAQMG